MTHPTVEQTFINMIAFHGDQMDKSGVPYFHHPARVMLRLGPNATDIEKHAALLHDVIEDTPITLAFLEDMGYCAEVLNVVVHLTKWPSETHRDYIYRILGSGKTSAMRVKLADLYDNANLARAERCQDPEVRATILSMIESRYKPAMQMVRQVLGPLANDIIFDDLEVQISDKGGAYADGHFMSWTMRK